MSNTDASRVWVQEGAFTFTETSLDYVLMQIDARMTCKNLFEDFTRNGNGDVITLEVYSDIGRTNLVMQRDYTYVTGSDNIEYPSTITTIFYNANGSEDSRVTTTITRDGDDQITACDNVFSTSEDTKL